MIKNQGIFDKKKHIWSIKILEIWIFWKIVKDYVETPQPK